MTNPLPGVLINIVSRVKQDFMPVLIIFFKTWSLALEYLYVFHKNNSKDHSRILSS